MATVTAKKQTRRELMVERAKTLAAEITQASISAGITQKELEKTARRAFLCVKAERGSNRS